MYTIQHNEPTILIGVLMLLFIQYVHSNNYFVFYYLIPLTLRMGVLNYSDVSVSSKKMSKKIEENFRRRKKKKKKKKKKRRRRRKKKKKEEV